MPKPSSDARSKKKPPREILAVEIDEALKTLERPASRLFLSGISAGIDVGFSVLLMGIVGSFSTVEVPSWLRELLLANMYSFGFVLVILGRSELFTEQTSLAFLPVVARRARFVDMLRLWGVVYVANIIGAAIFAAFMTKTATALGIVEPRVFAELARKVHQHDGHAILLSGMATGWLLGLLSWLVAASHDTISRIVSVWLTTTAIGLGPLHHAVAGSVEVFAGMLTGGSIAFGDYAHFLFWATLGNVIGGPLFISLKYGHAR